MVVPNKDYRHNIQQLKYSGNDGTAMSEDAFFRRSKSIDELYEEVKGFGLVITNDVALETALNSRIDTARIGELAITPRHIVRQIGPLILGKGYLSDLQIISAVSEETGLGFRQVYSEILNIREIRTHTAEVRSNLTSNSAKKIYDSYRALPTLEKAMSEFDPDDPRVSWFFERSGGVAVIGVDLFDDLDKHCIPFEYENIEIFTDDEYRIDRVYEVGNDRQLADNAVDLIDENDPTSFAIVLDASGTIADSVRAALYRRKLPFVNSLGVSDLAQIRDFLSFVTLAQSYHTLRVKSVKELFSNYNGFFKPRREEYLLCRQDKEGMREHAFELREVMRRISEDGMTFREVKDAICNNQARPQVTMILDELGVLDETVTPDRISEIRFAIENVKELKHNEQIPEDELHGVLLADCRNSVFVDRPVVIYIGMEQNWNIPVVGKRYLDPEQESENNAMRLSALLQQGDKRFYIANINKNGEPARPSLTFDIALEMPCRSFSDICEETVTGRWAKPSEPVDRTVGCIPVEETDVLSRPFSKSSFDSYVSCPLGFMFYSLLPGSDQTYTLFGTLIHEFAELYITHPDIVKEKGVDEFVDMVAERYAGLSTPLMTDLDRDRMRLAMINIMRYIDGLEIGGAPLDSRNSSKKQPNGFMEELGLDMTSTICESDHRSSSHAMHGIYDLYWNGVITDYKTGRAKDAEEIRKGMSLGNTPQYPEFQPLMYLALALESDGGKPAFNQFYAVGNDVASLSDDFDISENVRTVKLTEKDALELLRSPEGAAIVASKITASLKIEPERLHRYIMEEAPSDPSNWTSAETIEEALAYVGMKTGKTNSKNMGSVMKKLSDFAGSETIAEGSVINIPLAYLKRFLTELDAMHASMLEGITAGFPPTPVPSKDCMKCEFYTACTKKRMTMEDASDE